MSFWTKKPKGVGLKKEGEKNSFRLPKTVVPKHYAVCFKPFVDELSFEASVVISMTLLENSAKILLNATDVLVTKVIWEEDVTQNRQEPMEMLLLEKGQLSVNFDPFLIPQEGQLRMNFKGKISDKKMAGFYRSKCKVNEDDWNLITQFDPIDARRCLPCWDDPASRAPYDVSLVVPKGKTVVGNMPIKVIYPHKKNPALEIVEFKRTPPMSSHALAFAVGSFDYVESRSGDDEVLVRVYTPPGKKDEGVFALDIACKVLTYLAQYLNYPFPLQKLDLMAVADFPSDAEENWGLIMYQESHLLLDANEEASAVDKQNVALIVGEEIIKQWFGNLVTIEWWTHLWLKEGLATFLRYFCLEEVHPEFESASHFVTDIVQKAMKIDGLRSTHCVEVVVNNPNEVEELFDEICFKKGAAILRMLHAYIGDEAFRKGLTIYLNKYKFKSATTEDFWKCMEIASSKPVSSVMKNWATLKGFPIIKVVGKQDGKNRFLKLTQEKYSNDPLARDVRNESIWMIPLTVTSGDDPTSIAFETLMDSKSTTIVIPNIAKSEWVKLNPGVVGFFRVRYPPDMLTSLVHAIREKSLEPVDRLNILDDQFALLASGMGATVEILTLMEAFMEEDDLNVWSTISAIFDKLLKVFGHVNIDESVRHFGRYLYTRILERVGFFSQSNEHHQQTLLRAIILRMMTKFSHPSTLETSKSLFESAMKGEGVIPVDLRYIVYHSVLKKGDDEVLKSILKIYRETESIEEKGRIAHALGSAQEGQMIKHVLDFSISDDVQKQDTVLILISASKGKAGRDMAWNFFKDNFVFLKNRFGSGLGSKLIKGIVEDFASEEKAQEVLDFFKTNIFPGSDRAVQQGVESIRMNEMWIKRERNLPALQDYLEADAL